jgi:3-phosphoshikimate 1-carboxyvinyltransferase
MISIKKVKNLNEINASLYIPGSKSYSNRALIISSLAEGITNLHNLLISDDTKYMLDALSQLNVIFYRSDNKIIVTGCGNNISHDNQKNSKYEFFCGIAGTTSRFLTALSLLIKGEILILGSGRILQRPISHLVQAIQNVAEEAFIELDVIYLGKNGSLPLKIINKGWKNTDRKDLKIKVDGSVSSQYLSSILMIAPYLKSNIQIEVDNEQVSKAYIDITCQVMSDFGINVINENYKLYKVPQGRYKAINKEYYIEGDLSSAIYFFVFAILNKCNLKIFNINIQSKQGESALIDFLQKHFFLNVKQNQNNLQESSTEISSDVNFDIIQNLQPFKIDMSNMPDSAMSVAILALFCKGETIITGLSTLKHKETDRLSAMKSEIDKIMAALNQKETNIVGNVIIDNNSIIIAIDKELNLHKKYSCNNLIIETYDDHRIAMSFAILATKIENLILKDPGVVNKSFPEFWDNMLKCNYGS